jgi:mannose-6-phosphate isomerase-like protein (cupin superfamily)
VLKTFDELEQVQIVPGEICTFILESSQTNGSFAIATVDVEPMVGPPLHIHHDADEVLYVLAGEIDIVCGGKRFRTGPGGFAAIPKGTPHTFRNLSDKSAKVLGILSPGGFEQIGRAIQGRPAEDFPALANQFHMEIVGPPIEIV